MKLVIRDNLERNQQTTAAAGGDYLILEAEGVVYALSVLDVEHVLSLKYSSLERVHTAYDPLIGFLDWRGRPVPVLDLHAHLEAASAQDPGAVQSARALEGSVVIVKHSGGVCGLLVDQILQFLRIANADLEQFPVNCLASERKLYRATVVIGLGIAVLLKCSGVISQAIRDFLDSATADYLAARTVTSDE